MGPEEESRLYSADMADGSKSRASQYARASQRKDRRRPTRYDFPDGPVAGDDVPAATAVAPGPDAPSAGAASRRRPAVKTRSAVHDWRVQVADLKGIALVTAVIAVLMTGIFFVLPQ